MNINDVKNIPVDVLEGTPKQFDLNYFKMPDDQFVKITTDIYSKEVENVKPDVEKSQEVEIYSHDAINDLSNVSEIMSDDVYEQLYDDSDRILNDEILFDTTNNKGDNNYIDGYRLSARNVLTSSDIYSKNDRFNQDDLLGLTSKQAISLLNISNREHLIRLVKKGLIRKFKIGNRNRYVTSDIYRLINDQRKNKIIAIYARVWDGSHIRSSDGLKHQIKKLLEFATEKKWPVKRIYRDTSFGLDYAPSTRKGLHALLYDVMRGRVDFVLIESPDRLGIVGYELIVQLFKMYRTKIIFMDDTQYNTQYRNEMIGEFSFLQKMLHKSIRQGKIVNTNVDLSKINYKEILNI